MWLAVQCPSIGATCYHIDTRHYYFGNDLCHHFNYASYSVKYICCFLFVNLFWHINLVRGRQDSNLSLVFGIENNPQAYHEWSKGVDRFFRVLSTAPRPQVASVGFEPTSPRYERIMNLCRTTCRGLGVEIQCLGALPSKLQCNTTIILQVASIGFEPMIIYNHR